LMGLDFFQQAVAYQKKYQRPGIHIQNSFQTNGILLDEDWADFLHQNQFLVGLSLDGPAEVHDTYRRDKGGHPTHAKVMQTVALLKQHHVEFNILCCLHAASVGKGVEIYRFFRDEIGAQFIQFIPIIERDNPYGFQEGNRLTPRSIKPEQYGKFLIEVFDEWVRHDVGKVYVQIFDTALAVWAGYRAGLCIFEPTCGTGMALEHNGDLYACDHFVEPNYFLGNICQTPLVALASGQKQKQFGRAKLEKLPVYCMKCDVRFICNGECPKNRILLTPKGEPGLNYLCEGYKAFFHHIDKPMKMMAALLHQGRPPAEIKEILDEERPTSTAAAYVPKPEKRYRHKKK